MAMSAMSGGQSGSVVMHALESKTTTIADQQCSVLETKVEDFNFSAVKHYLLQRWSKEQSFHNSDEIFLRSDIYWTV